MSGSTSPIPRRHCNDPAVAAFLARGEPVILEDCPLCQTFVGKWSFQHLAEHSFDGTEQLQVHFAPSSSLAFSRVYGGSLGSGGVRTMRFADFVAAPTCNGWRHYLAAPVLRQLPAEHWTKPAWQGELDGLDELDELDDPRERHWCYYSGPIGEELFNGIDWGWLAETHGAAGSTSGGKLTLETCQLWAGRGKGATPLHFDALHNLLAQIAGRKHVTLFAPSQTWNVHPFPVGHPKDNFAVADPSMNSETAATDLWPGAHQAHRLEGVLNPGEALWLPRYYWHYVEQLDEGAENLSMNFWAGKKGTGDFQTRLWRAVARGLPEPGEVKRAVSTALVTAKEAASGMSQEIARSDDALLGATEQLAELCLLASRHIEGSCAELLGERSGQFLTALASGEPDLESSYGEAAARHGERVRAELIVLLEEMPGDVQTRVRSKKRDEEHESQLGLGARRCNALLRAMTRHGRLFPGLAPPLPSPDEVVNCEKGELTSVEAYERLLGLDSTTCIGPARCVS